MRRRFLAFAESMGSMTAKADHVAWAAEAVAVFQRHCNTGDEHAIADLICAAVGITINPR